MARKRKQKDHARTGEAANSMEMGRTNIERGDSSMSAGAHGDRMAGSEGVEEPSPDRTDENSHTDESEPA